MVASIRQFYGDIMISSVNSHMEKPLWKKIIFLWGFHIHMNLLLQIKVVPRLRIGLLSLSLVLRPPPDLASPLSNWCKLMGIIVYWPYPYWTVEYQSYFWQIGFYQTDLYEAPQYIYIYIVVHKFWYIVEPGAKTCQLPSWHPAL